MRKQKLGNSDLLASSIGLGCMGMSEWYGPTNDEESRATIKRAFGMGLNFFDTADVYGNGHNESLLGSAVREFRQDVILATKFGFLANESGLNGRPEYVKKACDASLTRLGTDYIDLYYLHRIDPEVPLTETVGAMADLVSAGKVRYLGLSEVSAGSLKKAAAVHPVTALQSEYSIWVRDIEVEIIAACRELQVALVPYSPLGRGFLTGKLIDSRQFGDADYRKDIPLFQSGNFEINLEIVRELEDIATTKHCKTSQLALAWLNAQGDDVFPIPGTKRRTYLEENIESARIKLTADELNRINRVSLFVQGNRKNDAAMKLVDR
ncbi:MAG: aldo/keto reductase [Xanthomonadales bacterium]|nr:aldo/keto reductase [Xanthomonadales bacterium]MDH4019865.1 aldo/keto reductase [Xanthomonadales bacterium]